MPRKFEIKASGLSRFNLSPEVQEKIKALILDLDLDATEVVEQAIARLHAETFGPIERDIFAELDALKARVAALEAKRA